MPKIPKDLARQKITDLTCRIEMLLNWLKNERKISQIYQSTIEALGKENDGKLLELEALRKEVSILKMEIARLERELLELKPTSPLPAEQV